VDAISGASEYAQWGPILMPSDNVNCIFIEPDGTQWFGTDAGVARHKGTETMENWMVLDAEDGLIDNNVQSIAVDHQGRVWIGTKAGVSVFENNSLRSLSGGDGLLGRNVRCITVDREGVVWIGTEWGVTSYHKGDITRYMN
jgi:ligand-binding sensor domain-containing protein